MIRGVVIGTGLLITFIGIILIILGYNMRGSADPLERVIKGVLMLSVGVVVTFAGVMA